MYPAVQLNEHLKRFIPACSKTISNQKQLAKALTCPYLTYISGPQEIGFSEEDAKAVSLMADDGLMRTPFPMFRFCVQSEDGSQMLGFVERVERALALVAFFRHPKTGRGGTFYAATFTKANPFAGSVIYDGRIWEAETLTDISEEYKYSEQKTEAENEARELLSFGGTVQKETAVRVREKLVREVGLKEKRVEQMRQTINEAETTLMRILSHQQTMLTGDSQRPMDMFMTYYCAASIICYEYLAPQNFTAIVHPNTPGKSVEWQKAREHMTLIHRGHPANNASVKKGDTVTADSQAQLKRCAHSRRAHTRLLKSAKFRFKVGQRVAVRATWCGPKEWQDSAGQTYQILIPVGH